MGAFKPAFILLLITALGLSVVSQRAQIVRLGYEARRLEHEKQRLVDANRRLLCETSALEGPLARFYAHPLPYAGMIHYITHWVRENHVLRLEEAIRKMTSMCATRFGLRDRGLVRGGAYADLVVFDYEALDDVSTIKHPLAYCRGVEYVLVNGQLVIDGGKHTGARPGRNLGYS